MRTQSKIDGSFSGWHGDALFKLTNGQFWIQAEHKYQYRYMYRPAVVITQSGSCFEMEVEGMNDSIRVRRANVIEGYIKGTFKGWSGNTEFELNNRQVWKQAAYAYWYHYAYRPEVMIYESGGGYMLCLADDPSNAIQVRRIR
jgi:hypothetical protein